MKKTLQIAALVLLALALALAIDTVPDTFKAVREVLVALLIATPFVVVFVGVSE